MLLYNMAAQKVTDERSYTKGGGIVRIELWQDSTTAVIVKCTFVYVNDAICDTDEGRVVGFDNSHRYTGHASAHHAHWMGAVRENVGPVDLHKILQRFDRVLKCLKRHHGKDY
jgi:hypothetical protein